MTSALRAAAWLAAAALAGCATVVPAPAPPGQMLSGRIAVNVEAGSGTAPRTVTANFELQGDAGAGRLDLATPLGTMLAQARWSAGRAQLVTAQGASQFDDLDTLAREMLGESLPVAALFDWLRGRPWPGAPSRSAAPPAAGFAQLGWEVDLTRFDQALVAARRGQPPVVTVRARVDRP